MIDTLLFRSKIIKPLFLIYISRNLSMYNHLPKWKKQIENFGIGDALELLVPSPQKLKKRRVFLEGMLSNPHLHLRENRLQSCSLLGCLEEYSIWSPWCSPSLVVCFITQLDKIVATSECEVCSLLRYSTLPCYCWWKCDFLLGGCLIMVLFSA